MNSYLKIFLFLLCLVSCNRETKKEYAYLSSYIEDFKPTKTYEWIVILPEMGCSGCIQEGEYFLSKYASNKSILFILTNITSLKTLQNKAKIDIKTYPNIIVDRKGYNLPSTNCIYPCIIKYENGQIVSYSFQSPVSQAFQDIRNSIDR